MTEPTKLEKAVAELRRCYGILGDSLLNDVIEAAREEAEEIERFAFEQGALAGYSRCSAGLETWMNNDEWECYLNSPLRRERRDQR